MFGCGAAGVNVVDGARNDAVTHLSSLTGLLLRTDKVYPWLVHIFSETSSSYWAGMGALTIVLTDADLNCPETSELAAAAGSCDGNAALAALGISGVNRHPNVGMVWLIVVELALVVALYCALVRPEFSALVRCTSLSFARVARKHTSDHGIELAESRVGTLMIRSFKGSMRVPRPQLNPMHAAGGTGAGLPPGWAEVTSKQARLPGGVAHFLHEETGKTTTKRPTSLPLGSGLEVGQGATPLGSSQGSPCHRKLSSVAEI